MRSGRVFLALLQGVKRGCARVPEDFEIAACLKHKKALTKSVELENEEEFAEKFSAIWRRSVNSHAPPQRVKDFETLPSIIVDDDFDEERHFADVKEKRWKKVSMLREFRRTLRNPSNHASHEATRDAGGRAGYIHRLLKAVNGGHHSSNLVCEAPLLDMYELRPGTVVTRYAQPLGDYKLWLDIASKCIAGRDNLSAQVELCLEPLKCRVITKGESVPYFVSQTIQRAAWNAMQDMPAAKLTSCPVDASMLYGIELMTNDLLLPFDQWVSGDYSAATDGLSLQVNRSCLTEMMNAFGTTDQEKELCMKVLGPHKISYPDRLRNGKDDGLEPFVMTNGQLMGSLLSFPVLCAINIAAYWCALEEYTGRKFKKTELPVLVNGDDILFKANKDFYEVWKKWITRAGFTLSLGKNYISPNFITVNSESWLHRGGSDFRKIDFLNNGLLLQEAQGPMKVPLRSCTAEKPLISKLEAVINTSVDPARTFDRVKHHWKKSIAIWTQNGKYNLCAPVEMGGCGLDIDPQVRPNVKFTEFQKLLAGAALNKFKSFNGCFGECRDKYGTGFERISFADNAVMAAKTVVPKRGLLSLHAKNEPLSSADVWRVKDPAAGKRVARELNTAQSTTVIERAVFRIRELPPSRLRKAFKLGSKIKEPFSWDLELRVDTTKGPTDDASLAVTKSTKCRPLKKAEMATEQTSACTVFPHSPDDFLKLLDLPFKPIVKRSAQNGFDRSAQNGCDHSKSTKKAPKAANAKGRVTRW